MKLRYAKVSAFFHVFKAQKLIDANCHLTKKYLIAPHMAQQVTKNSRIFFH